MPEENERLPGRLKNKQQAFLESYLRHWNAARAAREAGYSEKAAHVTGARMLTIVSIRQAIDARLAEKAMAANEVLARLADHARGSLEDFIRIEGGDWRLDLEKARELGLLHLVAELSYTEHGPRIKLHDAQAALVHLGRHHKLFASTIDIRHLADEQILRLLALDDASAGDTSAGETTSPSETGGA